MFVMLDDDLARVAPWSDDEVSLGVFSAAVQLRGGFSAEVTWTTEGPCVWNKHDAAVMRGALADVGIADITRSANA